MKTDQLKITGFCLSDSFPMLHYFSFVYFFVNCKPSFLKESLELMIFSFHRPDLRVYIYFEKRPTVLQLVEAQAADQKELSLRVG